MTPTDRDSQDDTVPFDVSGTVPSGHHYWAKLDTKIHSGHDTWYGPNDEVNRYGAWEYPTGVPYMVILP